MPNKVDKVQLSFLDSDSKSILNKINEKLDHLDQKLSFVTEFLLKSYGAEATKEEHSPSDDADSSRESQSVVITAADQPDFDQRQPSPSETTPKRPSVVTTNPAVATAKRQKLEETAIQPSLQHYVLPSFGGAKPALFPTDAVAFHNVDTATASAASLLNLSEMLAQQQQLQGTIAAEQLTTTDGGAVNRRKQPAITITRMNPLDGGMLGGIFPNGMSQPSTTAPLKQQMSPMEQTTDNTFFAQQAQRLGLNLPLMTAADAYGRAMTVAAAVSRAQQVAAPIKNEVLLIDADVNGEQPVIGPTSSQSLRLTIREEQDNGDITAEPSDVRLANANLQEQPERSGGIFANLTATLAWAKEQQLRRQAGNVLENPSDVGQCEEMKLPPTESLAFPEGALQRAADKAARSFESTQPKVFAWQMMRETIRDEELKNVHITLRTFSGEAADDLVNRQLPKIQNVVRATLDYFKCNELPKMARLSKAKMILSHLKNNTKVRSWTLREGRPSKSPNNPEVLWRKYAAYMGPGGLRAAGFPLPNEMPPSTADATNPQEQHQQQVSPQLGQPPLMTEQQPSSSTE